MSLGNDMERAALIGLTLDIAERERQEEKEREIDMAKKKRGYHAIPSPLPTTPGLSKTTILLLLFLIFLFGAL
jgi:hypothetical protein